MSDRPRTDPPITAYTFDPKSEMYWLKVIEAQARKAVDAWAMGQSVDADMLCLEKHLRALREVRDECVDPPAPPLPRRPMQPQRRDIG